MPQKKQQIEEMDFDPNAVYEEMDFDPSKPFYESEGAIGTGKGKIGRSSTFLESARNAMFELPQELLGTVAPMASRATGPVGAGIGSALAAAGGAAGRYLSEKAKELPTGLRGYMVGGIPGALLDVITSATSEDPTYEPRTREEMGMDMGLGEAALQEGTAQLMGEGVGLGVSKLRQAMKVGELEPPSPMFGQKGTQAGTYEPPKTTLDLARGEGVPVLPSEVSREGLGQTLESLARYGSGGRRLLQKFFEGRERQLDKQLTDKLDDISDVMSKEEAGQAFIQNMDAYRQAQFDKPAEQLYGQAEQLMEQAQATIDPRFIKAIQVDLRPVKQLIQDEWGSVPAFMQAAAASENMTLKRFASVQGEELPDFVTFADARQLRSDVLSMMRQGSTPDKVKRVEGEAVGIYNEAMADAARRAQVPEAMDMVETANALWKQRYEHFYNQAIQSLVKRGEKGPELVGSFVWQPGAVTQSRKALQALGGTFTDEGLKFKSPDLEKAWNITRRSGFEQVASTADRAANPHKKWADWWDKLDPDQRLLLANGKPELKKSYDTLFHAMRELDSSAQAKKLEGLGLQSPEKTALVVAALAGAGVGGGTGYLLAGGEGMASGGLATAAGFLGLAFLGPRVVGKLLTSQAGTNLLIDGTRMFKTPNGLTAENVAKFGARALSIAANTSEVTAQYKKQGLANVPDVAPTQEAEPVGEVQ